MQAWRSDGTDAGTVPVSAFTSTFTTFDATAARGQYFFGRNAELWATDGTAAGTRRVGTIPAGKLEVAGDVVYVAAERALARSDGTAAGTYFLKQFNLIQEVAVVGDRIFLSAASFDGPELLGTELWVSDGTVAGTVLVKDILPGPPPRGGTNDSSPRAFFPAGDVLFFSADDGVHGRELWQSDGTAAGTTLVRDIFAGPNSSGAAPLTRLGDQVYFAAADLEHGNELWRVDVPAPAAPTVRGVFLSGSNWPAAFKQALQDRSLGSADVGFAVPAGPAPLGVAPWANLDQVSLTFSADVQVDAGDLRVAGVGLADYALDAASFRYDPASRTATWKLTGGNKFAADRITVELNGDGPDGVRSAAGTLLDGDWINPAGASSADAAGGDAFPSGDGTPGGDFNFSVNTLPGDADRNGRVNALDLSDLKRRLNSTTTAGTGYAVFADVNPDGRINALDLSVVRANLNRSLPTTAAIAMEPAPVPVAGTAPLPVRRAWDEQEPGPF